MKALINKLYQNNELTKNEIMYLLLNMNTEHEKYLFNLTDITRKKHYKDKVYIRGLIEFSSFCKNTCKYCGLRRQNKTAERLRMTKDEIISCCTTGHSLGVRTFVLQSGEDSVFTDASLTDIISDIKARFPDAAITLSIGERSKSSYIKLFGAGADRYLLRHETADKNLYESLHPNMSFENRIRCLCDLKDIGYQSGSGFIVGVPGQTDETIAKDLKLLKEIHPSMIGIGPFIPHGSTPLAKCPQGSVQKTLWCMAIARLLIPDALIPVTTALAVLHPDDGWGMGLKAGANVIMTNLTPSEHKGSYEIYEGKSSLQDSAKKDLEHINEHIKKVGYSTDMGRGDHVAWTANK